MSDCSRRKSYVFKTVDEFKQSEQEVRHQEALNVVRFKWPNTITLDDRLVKVLKKFPNFAIYMMTGTQMNRKIVLDKPTYLKWLSASK
jgi:hypothetical protein